MCAKGPIQSENVLNLKMSRIGQLTAILVFYIIFLGKGCYVEKSGISKIYDLTEATFFVKLVKQEKYENSFALQIEPHTANLVFSGVLKHLLTKYSHFGP